MTGWAPLGKRPRRPKQDRKRPPRRPRSRQYAIELKPSAAEQLSTLRKKDQRIVAQAIDRLIDNPRPPTAKRLKGQDDIYRVRAGKCRILYQIPDTILLVLVLRVADRKDAYRGL